MNQAGRFADPQALLDPDPALRAVLDGISDGILVQEATGRLLYANASVARLLGYPSAAALLAAGSEGLASRCEVLDESGRRLVREELPNVQALRGLAPAPAALCWRDRESGVERWGIQRSTPLFDGSDRVVLVVSVLQDLTEQARQQRLLEETTSELEASLEQLRIQSEATEAARARVRSILETIADPFVAYDREWRFVYINGPAADLFRGVGREPDALLGRVFWEEFPGITEAPLGAALRRAVESGEPQELEVPGRYLPGFYEVHAYPGGDGVSLYFKDISEKKRALDALQESEARFREMADTAPVMIWMADASGGLVFLNRSWLEFTGRTAEAELGWGWEAGVYPADSAGRRAVMAESAAQRRGFRTEYRLRRSDGEFRWILESAVPRLDAGGTLLGFVGSAIDISERKRIEEMHEFLLRASSQLGESLDYETTLASVARLAVPHVADWCAVDVVQEDGSVRRVAVAHADPEREAWARALQERYPLRMDAPFGVARVLRTGTSELHAEIGDELLRRVARDAQHLELLRQVRVRSVMIVPLLARERALGALLFAVEEPRRRYDAVDLAMAEDLGRRAGVAIENARLFRAMEAARHDVERQAHALERAARELEAVNRELSARTAEAEEANRAKSQFLAMMSHELRTPLNAIAGYTELLELEVHGPVTSEQRQSLERIRASHAHLLGIINDVLNFARIEAGRIRYEPRTVRLDTVVSRAYHLVEPQVRDKGLRFAPPPDDSATRVWADEEKLGQILLNLLSNAVKFTPEGGAIEVTWETGPDRVWIHVRDTGPGIPEERLESIFEPFIQVDSSLTRVNRGVGLGLAISRELARAMEGELGVQSRLGEGSTFSLGLRRADAPDDTA